MYLFKGFLRVWSTLKYNYACSLLFLFSVSHILVLTHPVPVFDASYLSYFKALDCSRLVCFYYFLFMT